MYKKEDKIWFGLQGVTLDGSIWTFWISKKKTDKSGRRTRTTCTTCSIFSSSDNIYILNLFKHVLTYSYVKHFLISSWIFLHMSLYVVDHCSVEFIKSFHFDEQFEFRENFLWINTYYELKLYYWLTVTATDTLFFWLTVIFFFSCTRLQTTHSRHNRFINGDWLDWKHVLTMFCK